MTQQAITPNERPAPKRLAPQADDPLYVQFVEGLGKGKIVVPYSTASGRAVWPPRELCPVALRPPDTVLELPPRGVVYSYVICHRAFHPWFKDKLPYTIAIVQLEADVRMYGLVLGDQTGLEVGAPVAAVFSKTEDGQTVLDWQLARTQGFAGANRMNGDMK